MAFNKACEKNNAQAMLALALSEKLESIQKAENPDFQGFEVLEILGRGGMGTVYKALQCSLNRVVALKIFTAGGEGQDLLIERLKREGRMMAQLEHPNVLGIYDDGVMDDGTPYLILEYVYGEDLQQRIREKKILKIKDAIRIAVKVCEGLSAVHSLGVIHRDVKPANVMLGKDGSVKVTDFGVSKESEIEDRTALTMTGITIGTVDYMSPEQSKGNKVDERSDLYSVGVLLYEMITGMTPRGAFEPLSKFGVPKDLDSLIMRCLQTSPEKRPGSAANVSLELKKIYKKIRSNNSSKPSILIYTGISCLFFLTILALFLLRDMRPKNVSSPQKIELTKQPDPSKLDVPSSWVDLTKTLNTDEAALSGQWWNVEGTVVCNSKTESLLQLKSQPSGNYTLEYDFMRIAGNGEISFIIPSANGLFSVSLLNDSVISPELDNNRVLPNDIDRKLKLGVLYKVKIEVIDSRVLIVVNGDIWATLDLAAEKKLVLKKWTKANQGQLAIGIDGCQVVFSKLRIFWNKNMR